MINQNGSFRQRLQRGFRAGNAALTPSYILRTIVNSAVGWICASIALTLTGAAEAVSRFVIMNSWLLMKTVGVFCLLWPFGMVIGQFIRAFLVGLFDIQDKPHSAIL